MGRSLTTTGDYGPLAPGIGALSAMINSRSWLVSSNTFSDPLGNTADILPAPLVGKHSRPGDTDATANSSPAVASFLSNLDHVAHVSQLPDNLETRNSENEGDGFACLKKSLARMQKL